MYHCHMRLYLTGHPHRVFEIIKEMSPLEHFTHEFLESDRPEETLAAGADVIVADLQGYPDVKEAVRTLISAKAGSAELILLADREQILQRSPPRPRRRRGNAPYQNHVSSYHRKFRRIPSHNRCTAVPDPWS